MSADNTWSFCDFITTALVKDDFWEAKQAFLGMANEISQSPEEVKKTLLEFAEGLHDRMIRAGICPECGNKLEYGVCRECDFEEV